MSHLHWAALSVLVAALASLLGFTDVAATSAGVAMAFSAAFVIVLVTSWLVDREQHQDPRKHRQ